MSLNFARKYNQNSQNNFENKDRVGRLILHDFKTYYKAVVIKKEQYWCQDSHINQQNERVMSKRDPPISGYLIFVQQDSNVIQR